MTNRCLAIAVLALLASGCTDATGSVSGGQALIAQEAGGPPTWTALYKDFFGPGQVGCGALSTCHVSCTTAAGQLGGFTCTSKESCWLGMTGANQLPTDAGADGAGDAGVPSGTGFCNSPGVGPVVTSSLPPTKTPLYLALHQASSSSDNSLCGDGHKTITYSCNMPCGDAIPDGGVGGCHQQAASYMFTPDDLSRIATWIQQGAQYN